MKYLIRKAVALIVTVWAVSVLTFAAFYIIPGDSETVSKGLEGDIGEQSTKGVKDMVTEYCDWMGGIIKGDAGMSSQYKIPVSELIADRLKVTLILALMSLILIVVMALPLGIISARKQGGAADNIIGFSTDLMMATPEFFMGMILTIIFGIGLNWFKVGGYVSFKKDFFAFFTYMIAPAFAIALPKMSMTVKFLRNSIAAQLSMDYVRTAKSKGLKNTAILYKHVLKNSLVSVITFMAVISAQILAGSIVTEQVFSVPGMGRLLVTSILSRDHNVAGVIIMYIAFLVVLFNMIADIIYYNLDPKERSRE